MITQRDNITQHKWQKVIFWLIGAATTIFLTTNLINQPEQTLIIAAILISLFFASKNRQFGLYLIIFLPVIGELIRVPFGPANGVIISDIFIPLFILVWLASNATTNLRSPEGLRKLVSAQKSKLFIPFTLFIIIAGLSLVQSILFLNPQEIISGSLYLIRFLQYGLLYFVTIQSVTTDKQITNIIKAVTISTILLAIAGFIQLGVYPDLAALEEEGWDPHINRLVSTWLDPNFIGGLFAFIISILLGITLHIKKTAHKIGLLTIITVLAVALFLTYSRSAYLALGTGIFIISLLKSKKIIIIMLAIALIGISTSQRAQERVGELTQSITAIVITDSAFTPDPTAKLRIKSWEESIQLIKKRPLLGSGYNTLRTVMHQEGFIKNPSVHSGSGSDSSLLTILATTGILGFIPFILLYIFPIKTAFQNWRNRNNKIPTHLQGYSLGIIGGIGALLVHSFFVNSLLFPQIIIYFWICIGINEAACPVPKRHLRCKKQRES